MVRKVQQLQHEEALSERTTRNACPVEGQRSRDPILVFETSLIFLTTCAKAGPVGTRGIELVIIPLLSPTSALAGLGVEMTRRKTFHCHLQCFII